jgi:hypothetical protein
MAIFPQFREIPHLLPCQEKVYQSFLRNANIYKPLRPEWHDVQSLIEKLDSIPEIAFWRRFWQELPHKHTEAWYIQQALSDTWPDEPNIRSIFLVSRPNLDVNRGFAGQYPGVTTICCATGLMRCSAVLLPMACIPLTRSGLHKSNCCPSRNWRHASTIQAVCVLVVPFAKKLVPANRSG